LPAALPISTVDYPAVVRPVIRDIGYVDPDEAFHPDGLHIIELITGQAAEIAQAVFESEGGSRKNDTPAGSDMSDGRDGSQVQGAGDQGLMFGYATAQTAELMPLPIHVAPRLAEGLAAD